MVCHSFISLEFSCSSINQTLGVDFSRTTTEACTFGPGAFFRGNVIIIIVVLNIVIVTIIIFIFIFIIIFITIFPSKVIFFGRNKGFRGEFTSLLKLFRFRFWLRDNSRL
eukprot:Lithocolla_globosa_v1_NODE_845_length_3197_cov_8.324316.p5 type:complete len:110 gc:universal NODE_845_length_3197_cov_8.324316:2738-2409(-)